MMTDGVDLAGLLAIWPIAASFASQTPVGDLITLGRTSSALRSSLHGRLLDGERPKRSSILRDQTSLSPAIGKHQTADWAYLKSIAPFDCSSTTHTRGKVFKPCVYCSKPICDACIVRDSFKHRNENTFKNRLRYFCRDCWSEGRRTRGFKYPAMPVVDGRTNADVSSDINPDEKPYSKADEFCDCNLKDHGWLCLNCKEEQNSSATSSSGLSKYTGSKANAVECYGLDCTNTIDLTSPDKDRRRVCLWCQKPLRRPWGGEDRLAWNLKTIEARARNAESRSRDLEEYNRRRLQMMRMSRKEMRGTPNDETPIFVRHLDAVNYRNWMTQAAAPDPEDVWKSKNGFWRYRLTFLFQVQARCRQVKFTQIGGVSTEELSRVTREGAVQQARLNRDMYPGFTSSGPGVPSISTRKHTHRNKMYLNELKARIFEMLTVQNLDSAQITQILIQQYGLEISVIQVDFQLEKWQENENSKAELDQASSQQGANVRAMTLASGRGERETSSGSSNIGDSPDDSLESTTSPIVLQDEVDMAEASSPAATTTEDQRSTDPPPYAP